MEEKEEKAVLSRKDLEEGYIWIPRDFAIQHD